jgi:hypothetical protein
VLPPPITAQEDGKRKAMNAHQNRRPAKRLQRNFEGIIETRSVSEEEPQWHFVLAHAL